MKAKRFFFGTLAAICATLASCSGNDLTVEDNQSNGTAKTIHMNLDGGIVNFDEAGTAVSTRGGTGHVWADGEFLYVTFFDGDEIIPGMAQYSTTDGWSISFDGNIPSGQDLKCETRFFDSPTMANEYTVVANSGTAVYEDLDAKYTYSGGELWISSELTPKTGRIRFTGTAGQVIRLTGFKTISTYAPATNSFYTTNALVTVSVDQESGSTPYIYGYYTYDDRRIGLIGDDFAFTRYCADNVFQVGQSGYMKIPSPTSHNSWSSGLMLQYKGVNFKMIPVAGLSSGYYLIAETEVTEQLYNATLGTQSTSKLPMSNVSYDSSLSALSKLSNEIQLTFSLPTSEQWMYAAKGGNKSQGYTYSGSNIPGDVAWYASNATAKHNVKSKAPNELGIYDMSGNVAEFVSGLFHSGYDYPYFYGGSYSDTEASIQNNSYFVNRNYHGSYIYWDSPYNLIGFRPVININ